MRSPRLWTAVVAALAIALTACGKTETPFSQAATVVTGGRTFNGVGHP
jgi:predicted small secreted protein